MWPRTIICTVLVLCLIASALTACDKPAACVKTEVQTVVTYPNMAYLGFGPSWTAIALTPSIRQEPVCIEYEKLRPHKVK